MADDRTASSTSANNDKDGPKRIPPNSSLHTEATEKPKRKPKDACPFYEFGCEHRGSDEKGTHKHIGKEPIRHLTLLCDAVALILREAALLQMRWEDVNDQFDDIYVRHDRMQKRYGSHLLWKIPNFEEKFNEAKSGSKTVIFSPPFMTGRHGYKMIVSASLYGDGQQARGKFMSVFISIMKGPHDSLLHWPFHHHVKITLLSQTADLSQKQDKMFIVKPNPIADNHVNSSKKFASDCQDFISMLPQVFLGQPERDRNPSFGAAKFIELDALQGLDFVKDDTIYLQIQVDLTDNFLRQLTCDERNVTAATLQMAAWHLFIPFPVPTTQYIRGFGSLWTAGRLRNGIVSGTSGLLTFDGSKNRLRLTNPERPLTIYEKEYWVKDYYWETGNSNRSTAIRKSNHSYVLLNGETKILVCRYDIPVKEQEFFKNLPPHRGWKSKTGNQNKTGSRSIDRRLWINNETFVTSLTHKCTKNRHREHCCGMSCCHSSQLWFCIAWVFGGIEYLCYRGHCGHFIKLLPKWCCRRRKPAEREGITFEPTEERVQIQIEDGQTETDPKDKDPAKDHDPMTNEGKGDGHDPPSSHRNPNIRLTLRLQPVPPTNEPPHHQLTSSPATTEKELVNDLAENTKNWEKF